MSCEGARAVVDAWGGGALRYATSQLILWGGGHADYGGNELYAINYSVNPASWQRIFGPTLAGAVICNQWGVSDSAFGNMTLPTNSNCSSGGVAPNARHVYGDLTYLPANGLKNPLPAGHDGLANWGGITTCAGGGCGDNHFNIYDFVTGTWSMVIPSGPISNVQNSNSNILAERYDPDDGFVYIISQGGFGKVDMSTSPPTFTYLSGAALTTHVNGTIDRGNNKFVLAAPDLGAGVLQQFSLSGTYEGQFTCSGYSNSYGGGMAYDERTHNVVLWPGFGSTIWVYNSGSSTDANGIPAHSCVSETYAGGPPNGISSSNGTFGRFQYVPLSNGHGDYFTLVNDSGWSGGGAGVPYLLCRKSTGCTQ
jgi:hypothetical protein